MSKPQLLKNAITRSLSPQKEPYPSLTRLKCAIPKGLAVSFSPYQAPMHDEVDILPKIDNPLYPAVVDKINRLPQDQLRWRFVTWASKDKLSKAVLRNYLRRKWSEALVEALKSRGFRVNGQRRVGEGSGNGGLRGTLYVLVHGGLGFPEPKDRLVKHCDTILEAVGKKQLHLGDDDRVDAEIVDTEAPKERRR